MRWWWGRSVAITYHSVVPFWVFRCPRHTQSSSELCRRTIFPWVLWTSQMLPAHLHSLFLILPVLLPLLIIIISKRCGWWRTNANSPSGVILRIVWFPVSLTKWLPVFWSIASHVGLLNNDSMPMLSWLPFCPLPANTLSPLIVSEWNEIINRMTSLHTWWWNFIDCMIPTIGNEENALLVVHDNSRRMVKGCFGGSACSH